MICIVVAGATRTAAVDGISAAGQSRALLAHTPAADLEILAYGRPVRAPVVPVSPTGCPTPAVTTRAVAELSGLEFRFVDAGLATPTAAETDRVGATPGADLREPTAVENTGKVFDRARALARDRGDDPLMIGETIPGGTTTALGVLTALGERRSVSSSLSANPIERKRDLVAEGLATSDLEPGDAAGQPLQAVRAVGDPVLAAVAGIVVGARDAGADVTLAGGTQLAAAAALARHAGVDAQLTLATTTFVADDDSADLLSLAADLDLDLVTTDPGFDDGDHPALAAYENGEAKEGVAMGGALATAQRRGVPMARVRERFTSLVDRLVALDRADGHGEAEQEAATSDGNRDEPEEGASP